MKTDSPLRFYRWLLLCVFIVAELLLLSLDLFYLIVQGESIASFFADFGIVTVIVTVLVLFIYYALKHVLLKYEDAEEALRQTQFTVDQSADSVFWVTSTGKIIFANDEACRRCGYTQEEMLSLTIFDINVDFAADNDLWESCVERIQRESHFTIEFRHRTKGGEVFPVEAMLNFFELEDGWLFVANVRDITDRKAAEEALRESEGKYRLLADSLPEIVFEMDLEGNLLYVSMSAFTFQGYTQEEFEKGMTVTDVLVDWDNSLADLKIRIDKNIKEASGEYTAKRKDGTTFPVIISSRLVYDGGRVTGLSGVVTNITEQKKTEENLKRMNTELNGYAYTVSHDLKGPLATMRLSYDFMHRTLRHPLSEEERGTMLEIMETGQRSIVRLTGLIDDLLILAETGKPTDVYPVNITERVNEILLEKKPDLEVKNIKVSTDPDLGTAVANPTHIYQVFANLIKNAIRHVDSEEPVIEIRLLSSGNGINRYLVRDNGPGIPEDLIPDIFSLFVKGKEGDTGIGLSIVEKIVQTYDGEIKAYNENGACFEFTLKDFSYQAS